MIILASNSELRKLIMESSGLPFRIETGDVDERAIEDSHPTKTPEEVVKILALAKAKVIAHHFPDDTVIAADTFGILPDGKRLHKTSSLEESIQLALRQSGQTIVVNTGIAIVHQGEITTDLTSTRIKYSAFDEATVRLLFQKNKQAKRRNAALGFFIDAPGFTLVEKVEGSYLGAMGLPMEIIRTNLEKIGYK
jgi:septum formation protein